MMPGLTSKWFTDRASWTADRIIVADRQFKRLSAIYVISLRTHKNRLDKPDTRRYNTVNLPERPGSRRQRASQRAHVIGCKRAQTFSHMPNTIPRPGARKRVIACIKVVLHNEGGTAGMSLVPQSRGAFFISRNAPGHCFARPIW